MESRILVEVAELVNSVKEIKGRPFDPQFILSSCVINVIYSIIFGSRFDLTSKEMIRTYNVLKSVAQSMLPELNFFPLLRFLPHYRKHIRHALDACKQWSDIVDAGIDMAMAEEDRESFAKSYLKSDPNRKLLNRYIWDLFGAAVETTTESLKWWTILLANNPGVEERLQKEIDSVVPRDRLPTLDDRPHLPFVEAAILELTRLKTMVPFAIPHKTLRETTVGTFTIPANTTVYVFYCNIYLNIIIIQFNSFIHNSLII